MKSPLLLLRGNEIVELFRQREAAIVDAVRAAYIVKESGDCSIPNCEFLRFPGNDTDRIIPKPAFLGGSFQAAGIKWVASFPGNLKRGIERASATLILNSTENGLPFAIMESSVISAYRTAASAALAATVLRGSEPVAAVGILGCGLINFETLRFLLAIRPEIHTILLFDLTPARAAQFERKCAELSGERQVAVASSVDALFQRSEILSIATTATTPHLARLSGAADVILHTSLRDFMPPAILMADNIVDDVEHACSNRTSLDLTTRQEGNHTFIRATIGAILNGSESARSGNMPVIFSPFGLGILDLAVAHLAYDLACAGKAGTIIPDFMPDPWMERQYYKEEATEYEPAERNPLHR